MSDVYYYYYYAFISRHVIIPIYKEKGLWKLPWDKADVTYYEDLGKEH